MTMKNKTMMKITMLAAALGLTGCAGPAPIYYAEITWNDIQGKTNKPADQWSEALIVAEKGMYLVGVKDVKRGDVEKALNESGAQNRLSGNAADLALVIGGSASGNAGAGAMGLGLWLLPTGQSKSPVQLTQIAAWVPSSEAPNFQAAGDLVLAEWNNARQKVFTKSMTQLQATPAALPYGVSANYDSLTGTMNEHAFKLVKNVPAKSGPDYLPAGNYYGPIFLTGAVGQAIVDEPENGFQRGESYIALSKALPRWMAVYDPGYKGDRLFPGRVPAVYREGKQFLFIEPQ